jgi:hypothetical protein
VFFQNRPFPGAQPLQWIPDRSFNGMTQAIIFSTPMSNDITLGKIFGAYDSIIHF